MTINNAALWTIWAALIGIMVTLSARLNDIAEALRACGHG